MANWEPKNISDTVKEIEDGKYVLPVIQRRLVWEDEKMETLFDTVLKGDSFGGIMVIKEDKDTKPLFNFRPFTNNGNPIPSTEIDVIRQSQNFVIDGQQRLQTFYIGLRGSLFGKILYFDLFSNYNSKFEFEFNSENSKLPTLAKDDSSKVIKAYKWYPVNSLYDRLKISNNSRSVAKAIISALGITEEVEKDHVIENVDAFYRNIFAGRSLGICEVAVDKTPGEEIKNRQRIVELFRRLNDGGTRLSPFDLVASVFKGFDWRMESFLEETIAEYDEIGLTQDNLIKLIFLLQDNHRKDLSDIEANDASFAVDQRKRIVATLEGVRKFLHASDLFHYYKDSNRSFIPLFFVAYHLFHKDIPDNAIEHYFDNHDADNPEFPRVKTWVEFSLLSGVFRSKGAGWIAYKTGIRKILEEIKLYKNQDFPCRELFDVYYGHGVTFTEVFDVSTINSLDQNFLFYLMYDRKQVIRIQDIDHIMPKSLLESLNFPWEKINNIGNYQLIDYSTNRGDKNAKPFKLWINTLPDKSGFVARHLIPSDEKLWDETEFEKFLSARTDLILAKVHHFIGGKVAIPSTA